MQMGAGRWRTGRLMAWTLACLWIATMGTAPGQEAPSAGPTPTASAEPTGKELEPAVRKVREGRNDEALASIRELSARHPEWPPAPLILARILLAADQGVPARRALERASAEAPGHPAVYLSLGNLGMADGRFSDARLNFDHALALASDEKARWGADRTRAFRIEALAGLATADERREDWASARNDLAALLEIEPKNGAARQRLGAMLFRLGRTDEAFEALKQAVADAPQLEPAAVSMARLAAQKGDPKKADEWFDYATKAEPNNARVRLARAGWLLDQGRPSDARAEADEALRLDPKSNDVQRLRGLIAWHLRDLTGAEAILEPLHRDAPADLVAANLLALCLVEQDDPAKKSRGLQLAEVDAQQEPRLPDLKATLGWAQFRSGQTEPAEKALTAAVQGARVSPDIAFYLASVLAARGRTDDARRLLQTAVDLPGAFAHRDDARGLLKSLAK